MEIELNKKFSSLMFACDELEKERAENVLLKAALEAIVSRCNHWAKGPAHDVRHDVALIARRALGKDA